MLDHVGIPVSDFERSKRFYEQALSPLGYELIMEPRYGAAGLGRSGKPDFWVFQGESGHAVHVAFVSDDRATVEAFFEAAIAAGATTAVSGFAPSTIRPTLGPSSSIRTATTSKRSAMGQQKKPEPSSSYSPRLEVGVFSEIQAVGSTHPPCTVRTDNAPKVRFSARPGEEPEIDVALA
jgi:hypothetical protein